LASIYEQIGEMEMGNAMGIFERHQLLGMAYQGLNANNMVYNCVKANGKTEPSAQWSRPPSLQP